MYETLKTYDKYILNYFKTIMYLKDKLSSPMEYCKSQELFKVLKMLEGSDKE